MKDNKIKLAVINHALVIPVFRRRWEKLAQDKNIEVHLIVPEYWEQTYFGERIIYKTEKLSKGNYHIHPLPTDTVEKYSTFHFKSKDLNLKKIQPDIIYMIGAEGMNLFQQVITVKKEYVPDVSLVFFTMNARGMPHQRGKNPIKKVKNYLRWLRLKNNTDAAIAHYPGCLKSLRNAGYDKPVFLQTQVGVDETLFAPNLDYRKEYRDKLNYKKDDFVIGFCGRLIREKGVLDIVAACSKLRKQGKRICLLMVGNGEIKEEVLAKARECDFEDFLTITGFVDQADVPRYMNAMDTLVLGSKTTKHWIDTFPLVTVQAQATGIPVIASDSASLPWQLADSAILFPESNVKELEKSILKLLSDSSFRTELAQKGRKRSIEYFCHGGMTKNFKLILNQLITNSVVYHTKDERYTQEKAY